MLPQFKNNSSVPILSLLKSGGCRGWHPPDYQTKIQCTPVGCRGGRLLNILTAGAGWQTLDCGTFMSFMNVPINQSCWHSHSHKHKYTYANTRTQTQVHLRTRTHTHAYAHAQVHTHTHFHFHLLSSCRFNIHIRNDTHTHTHTQTHSYSHTRTHTHTDTHR